MGGKASRDAGGKGERDVGRLMLQEGYMAWRTSQNRQSKLDTESDDVAAGMVPEHMRRAKDGSEAKDGQYLDLYHIDRASYPDEHSNVKAITEFEVIPNLNIEVKNGYDCKTYNKQFQDWLDKLKDETPEGYMWALFWRRKYTSKYEYRVCYERNGITVLTINEAQTRKAIHEIAALAKGQTKPPTTAEKVAGERAITSLQYKKITQEIAEQTAELHETVKTMRQHIN